MSEEVEIWQCPECGERLDISALGFFSEVLCPKCAHRSHVHTQLANFRLDGVLGIGGMSIVLSATDLILNRHLAIKVLNDTYRDQPERIARFENECAMMARVRHENVVSVYSAGWARGQFYIAMELIRGNNLESLVTKKKPMVAARALDITREVVLGLQAANKAGMLHRDMKPGNVIISEDGKAKVLDFGLSLNVQSEDTEEVIWATPYYVPPETLKREAEDVRTDIYALGMTLRFLLTGEHSLPGKTDTLTELVRAKRHLPPFQQSCPQAPPALCSLVDHMTAYKPADRPASYTSLLEELDDVRGIVRAAEESKSPKGKRRKRALLTGCVVLTAFAGLVGAGLSAWIARPAAVQAGLPYEDGKYRGDLGRASKLVQGIKASDWQAVNALLEPMSEETAEPTLAATAALLRAYMAVATEGAGAESPYLERFHAHLQRTGAVSPAAKDFFKQLQRADNLLEVGNTTSADDLARPVLRGIVYAVRAKRAAVAGDSSSANSTLEKARNEFRQANVRFVHLGDLLGGFSDSVGGLLSQGGFNRVRAHLSKHEFNEADQELAALSGKALPAPEQAKLQALGEISRVGRATVEVLKSRRPKDYRPGMSAEELQQVASKVPAPGWTEEVYALGLLLAGDYEAAFNADPYRVVPKSTRPFAILMRSWKAALNPPANQPAEEE